MPNFGWASVEWALLFFGVLGAFAAYSTGDTVSEMVMPPQRLLEAHQSFAFASVAIYSLILLGEALSIIRNKYENKINSIQIKNTLLRIENILRHKIFSKVLALIGLVSITLTGMLGGVMVYGTTADPMASIVLKLLNIQI